MKADASWTNGYFAKPASSTVEGTLLWLKRPRRGTVNVESSDTHRDVQSAGRRSFRIRIMLSPDGSGPKILRGSLPGTRARDPGGRTRPRPSGASGGSVFPVPRGRARIGPRGRERVRCPDGAAGAGLACGRRSTAAGLAMVRELCPIPSGRSEESEGGGRLGFESIPPVRRRSRLRAGGRPPPNSHGDHPQRIAPRICEGPSLPPVRGVWELLVLPTRAKGRSDPGPR